MNTKDNGLELFNYKLIQDITDPESRIEALRQHLIHYPSGITSEVALLNLLLTFDRDLQDSSMAEATAWQYLRGQDSSISLRKSSGKFLLLKYIKEPEEILLHIVKEIGNIKDGQFLSDVADLF